MKSRGFIWCCLWLCVLSLSAQDLPSWVSADGLHSFEGRFVDLNGDVVTLQNADGEDVQVPLTRLDQDSRNRALSRDLHPDSDWRRVLYSHFTDRYRLTLHNHHDFAHLEIREGGTPIPYPPIILRIHHRDSRSRLGEQYDFRAMVEPPRMEGDTLIWRARMQNDVIVENRIRLLPDGIDHAHRVERSGSQIDDPRIAVVAVFPPVLRFDQDLQRLSGPLAPDGVGEDGLDRLMRPYSVRYRPERGRTESITYQQSRANSIQDLVSVEFRGPYTSNPISLLAPDGRDPEGLLSIWYYGGGRRMLAGPRIRHEYNEFPSDSDVPGWFRLRL